MAVNGFFYNSVNGDRMYNGQDMNEDKAPFYKEGVAYGQLGVTAGEGMEVKVDGGSRTGYAYINMHSIHNTTILNLHVSQASGNLPRIDRVVLRNDEMERKPSIYILEGKYSSNPQPPDLTNTDAIQEKCLAEIYVAAGAVQITQADIKDTRADATLCGFIASQFVDIDFSQFTRQFDAFFNIYKKAVTDDFGTYKLAMETYLANLEQSGDSQLNALVKSLVEFESLSEQQWNEWFEGIRGTLASVENGEMLEELMRLIQELYRVATEDEIDRIIGDAYEDTDDGCGSIFEAGTDQDIDDIIGETYVEAQETEDTIDIDGIVNSAFVNV